MIQFIWGFGAGILFVIVLSVILAAARPETISRNTSRFFMDLKGRKMRRHIKRINSL
jgi:hypothetical protein